MATYIILTPRRHNSINHFSGIIHTRDSELSQRALKLHCKDKKLPTSKNPATQADSIQRRSSVSLFWPHCMACCCLVAESCPTLCGLMDCSPTGSSVRAISQARILKQVAISFSRGSSWPRDRTRVSSVPCTGRWVQPRCAACADFSSLTRDGTQAPAVEAQS